MALSRETVAAGLPQELDDFAELVRSLSDVQLATPTRCAGWTVGDVAAHVTGTMADIAVGRIEGQGTDEVTARQVEERRGRTGTELADELSGVTKVSKDLLAAFDDAAWAAPAPGGYDMTLGDAVEALWYDAYVHAEDIRAALGRPPVKGAGIAASVSHLAVILESKGWGPATLALDGVPRFDVNGGGREVTGDPYEFILAATGRKDVEGSGFDGLVNVYA